MFSVYYRKRAPYALLWISEENKSNRSGDKENLAREIQRATRSSKIVYEGRWRIESGWWIKVTRMRSDQIGRGRH